MDDFTKGLSLSKAFYDEIVAEILKSNFPELNFSAALIGWGSEVLGYDDSLSADHNWGLRFQLFLETGDYERFYDSINQKFAESLPREFKNYPIFFEIDVNSDQRDPGKRAAHNIDLETIDGFFGRYLGFIPSQKPTVTDWLTFPENKLLGVTSGRVFHDGLGRLEQILQSLSYYPHDVWLYLLSVQWGKIFEEQAFIGRSGYSGDELGSRLIAARHVKHLMQLCFFIERKYAPYSKWFGTAFSYLDCSERLAPILDAILEAQEWKNRESHLARAYKVIIANFNELKLTDPMSDEIVPYFDRPFRVIKDSSVIENLRKMIIDDEVLKSGMEIGSVNQLVESDDILTNTALIKRLRELYR